MQKYLKKIAFTSFLVLQILILVGCGGGGSSGGSPANPTTADNGGAKAPTVQMPLAGVTKVELNPTITLNFSEAVAGVSGTTVTIHEVHADGESIGIQDLQSNADHSVYTFKPAKNLKEVVKYYVVLSSGITSVATGQALVPTSFSFTTGDYLVPELVNSYPSKGDTNMPTSIVLQVAFSTSVNGVNENSIVLHEGSVTGNVVPTTTPSLSVGNTYSFEPLTRLKTSTTYYVELSPQTAPILSSTNAQPMQPANFSFTTGTDTAPTVKMTSPLNGSTIDQNVPSIRLLFSESVTSVNNTTVTLHAESPTGTSVPLLIIANSGSSYAINPTVALSVHTKYYLVLTNGITATATKEPLVPTNFNFTFSALPYAYVADELGIHVCTLDTQRQITKNCSLTYSIQNAYGITVNPQHTFAYIAQKKEGLLYVCNINRTSGALTGCVKTGIDGIYTLPTKISFNPAGDYAYVANRGADSVLYCKVNTTTGSLTSCKTTGENGSFKGPYAVAIDANNKYAYVTNTDNNSVTLCDVKSDGQFIGSLFGCVKTGTGSAAFNAPVGIAIGGSNNYVYTTNKTKILSCILNSSDGTLSGCTQTATGFTFNEASSIELHNYSSYITDAGTGVVTLCRLDDRELGQGEIGDCQNSLKTFTKPRSVAIMSEL